jgi:hypothetical protein
MLNIVINAYDISAVELQSGRMLGALPISPTLFNVADANVEQATS